jgi:DinB superfamily
MRRQKEMKHIRILCLLAVLSIAVGAMAQAKPAAAPTPAPQAQTTPQAPPTVGSAVDTQIGIIEREIVSAAEAMPEDKYNFAPTSLNIPGSDYKGVRTFAQQLKHVATVNFILWTPLLGEKPPQDVNNGEGPAAMTSKADIVKYLKDSYATGHRAAKSITADNVVELLPAPFGPRPLPRLFFGTFGVAHAFDHYGQIVEYLRMNGIVPPASRGGNN